MISRILRWFWYGRWRIILLDSPSSGQGFAYNLGRGVSAFAIIGAGTMAMSVGIGNALAYSAVLFILAIFATFLLPETVGKELE